MARGEAMFSYALSEAKAARQLTYHAAIMSERAMRGEKMPTLTFASSAAKCFASDAAMDITTCRAAWPGCPWCCLDGRR